MTYEVQQTRWDRIIRRVSGSIGPGSRVSETLSELFPVLDVERLPSELLLLGGVQLVMGECSPGNLAANFAQAMIRNPLGSAALITVTQIAVASGTSQIIGLGVTNNVLTAAGSQTIRDGRRGPAGVPVGTCLEERLLVAGPVFYRFDVVAGETYTMKDPNDIAVLAPGTALSVTATTINTNLRVGFLWRERPAEESELSI